MRIKNFPIGIKLNLFFILLVVVPLVGFGALSSVMLSKMKLLQVQNSSEQYLKQSEQGIEYTLTELDNIILSNLWNEDLLDILHQSKNNITTPDEKNKVSSILQNIVNTRTDINAIVLLTGQSEQIIFPNDSETDQLIEHLIDFKSILTDRNLQRYEHGEMVWVGIEHITDCVMGIRKIRDFETLESLGTICIFLREDTIRHQYTNLKITANSFFVVVDDQGSIVSSDYDTEEEIAVDTIQDDSLWVDGRRYFVNSVRDTEIDWDVYSLTPYSEIMSDIYRVSISLFSVILVILGVLILIMYRYSRTITSPIRNLQQKMLQVQNGEFDIEADIESKDEIGQLAVSFNNMTKQIQELIRKDYQSKLLIKEAQLKMLRAQINPHFLYNTLDNINWMALMGRTREVSKMAISLGRIMRWSISGEQPLSDLSEELLILEDYLSIQKLRLGDSLSTIIDAEEEALPIKVPRMILQPLVENAICHGLEPKSGEKRIVIRAFLSENVLFITIEDNGIGIQAETLQKLRSGEGISKKNHGIGYANVNQRIRITFGEPYGLMVESAEQKGTKITITIPTKEGSDEH